MIKKSAIRIIRKTAHLSTRAMHKGAHYTGRVENKTTRILNGTDYSMMTEDTIPLEKVYYNSLKYITPINPALPAIGSLGSIVLLLPSLDGKSFYGGTATALVVAGQMAIKSGKNLKVVQTLVTGKVDGLSSFFKSEGIDLSDERISIVSVADRAYNLYGYLSMHPDDLYIASAWWDAHLLSQLPLNKKFVYLIQDFEPIFYNNGDLYVLAESTYKLSNFVPICNTKLMYDFMKEREYPAFSGKSSNALWFEPAVSRINSGLVEKKSAKAKKRLFLYGRPDVHRNLFFLALNSIDYAFKAGFLKPDEWELFMAGQDNIPAIQLTSGPKIHNLGKMKMAEYVQFSKTIDVAVSPMMAPHPNYPTLEFASIGAAVVTTKYANKTNLSKYSANIIMCDIDTESMAGAIKYAANIEYTTRVSATKKNAIPTDWNNSLDSAILQIIDKI